MSTQTFGEWIKSVMEEKGLTVLVCCRRAFNEEGKAMQHSQWNALMEDEPKKGNGDLPERSAKVVKRVALGLNVSENEARLAAGLAPLPEHQYNRSPASDGERLRDDLSYEPAEDEDEAISYYRGISEDLRPAALAQLRILYEADKRRAANEEPKTFGKRPNKTSEE